MHIFAVNKSTPKEDGSPYSVETSDFIKSAYQMDFAAILGDSRDDFNPETSGLEIGKLYSRLKHITHLADLMDLAAANFQSTDKELGLVILHSFDYLHMMHPIIVNALLSINSGVKPESTSADITELQTMLKCI
jgi:hypothetical protein